MGRSPHFSKPGIALTAPVFYIVLSLQDRERHGYEILKHVLSTSSNRVRLGPGTLYTTLKRLLTASVITEVDARHEGDQRRRYYRLTATGRKLLSDELSRMEQALQLAHRRPVEAAR